MTIPGVPDKVEKRDPQTGQFLPGNQKTRVSLQSPPQTHKEASTRINKYINDCEIGEKSATIPGLAFALGFTSRSALFQYIQSLKTSEDPAAKAITTTLKGAKLYIEGQRVQRLVDGKGNATGAIFDLKNNFGYLDKHEVEQTRETSIKIVWQDPAQEQAVDVTPDRIEGGDNG